MKRALSQIAVIVMLGGGLVAVTGGAAEAACPYTGCVPTRTRVNVANAPVVQGEKAKVCIQVVTSGSGVPRGHAKVSVRRNVGGFFWVDTKRYPGKRTCFTTPNLRRAGKYAVRASFYAAPGSVFGNSSNVTALHVRRR